VSEHAIFAVLRSAPINADARKAVRQGNCSYSDTELTRAELTEIMSRLQRKLGLLKLVLSIDNKAKHSNLIAAIKGKRYGSGKFRARQNPRSAIEYVRVGQEIQRMNRALQELKCRERGQPVRADGWVAA
jgi:hypothetical protein